MFTVTKMTSRIVTFCSGIQFVDMPSPYGNCEPSTDYVRSKCLDECEANYVIRNCSCKDMSMPGQNIMPSFLCSRYREGVSMACCNRVTNVNAINSKICGDSLV